MPQSRQRTSSRRSVCVSLSPCSIDAAPPRTCGATRDAVRRASPRRRGDLRDQLGLALEGPLVAQALPELERQPLAVQVAGEVEQERLDPALAAAVVRVGADRDRGAVTVRGARVDAVARDEQARLRPQVRGREAERAAARVACDDRSDHLGRPPEQPCRPVDLAGAEQVADPGRRDALDERHGARVEAEAARAARGRPPGRGRSGSSRPRPPPPSRSAAAPARRTPPARAGPARGRSRPRASPRSPPRRAARAAARAAPAARRRSRARRADAGRR